jgi:hypothetical protein
MFYFEFARANRGSQIHPLASAYAAARVAKETIHTHLNEKALKRPQPLSKEQTTRF